MKRYLWMIGVGIAIVLAIIVAGMSYAAHFASTVNTTHKAPGAAAVTITPIPSTGLRTFQIVPAQSTASYSVYENRIIQNNDVVGTTHSVQGSFKIRTGTSPLVAAMNIKIDLRTLQSDSQRRDSFIQQNTLQTDTYPYTTFVSTSTQGLPASYVDGQTVHFQITGNLTMHGQTNKEVFNVQGKVVGNTITGTATSTIYMTDFGIQPPNLGIIVIVQNKVDITLTFTAQAA